MPLVPGPGVPAKVAVAEWKVTPLGSPPVTVIFGAGKPVAVTGKVNAEPVLALAVPALVMAGGWVMVRVKVWRAVPAGLAAADVADEGTADAFVGPDSPA